MEVLLLNGNPRGKTRRQGSRPNTLEASEAGRGAAANRGRESYHGTYGWASKGRMQGRTQFEDPQLPIHFPNS
jgi:hypothetical protein